MSCQLPLPPSVDAGRRPGDPWLWRLGVRWPIVCVDLGRVHCPVTWPNIIWTDVAVRHYLDVINT